MTYSVQWSENGGAWDTTTGHPTLDSAHAYARILNNASIARKRHGKATQYRVVDERGHVRHV